MTKKYKKRHPNQATRTRIFCATCRHGVVDMGKHIHTEEHKRNVRHQSKEYVRMGEPKLIGEK